MASYSLGRIAPQIMKIKLREIVNFDLAMIFF